MTIVARRRKDGSTAWGVSVYDADTGKQRWVGTYATRTEAKQVDADTAHKPSGETFSEYADEWLANRKPYVQPTTYENYTFYLRRARDHFGSTPVVSITERDCERLSAAIVHEMAPLTAHSMLTAIQAVLYDARRAAGAPALPKLRKPKHPRRKHDIRPLTAPEHLRLIAADAHYADLFAVWPLIGLRPGEMYGLRAEDIRIDGLHVEHQRVRGKVRPPKYGSARVVPLTDEARAILTSHTPVWSPGGWLFTTQQGSPLDTANFGGLIWPKIRKAAKLPDLHLHDLRHTFASRCLHGGLDIGSLSEHMGHRSYKVTYDTYCHLMPSDADAKASRLAAALASS